MEADAEDEDVAIAAIIDVREGEFIDQVKSPN